MPSIREKTLDWLGAADVGRQGQPATPPRRTGPNAVAKQHRPHTAPPPARFAAALDPPATRVACPADYAPQPRNGT